MDVLNALTCPQQVSDGRYLVAVCKSGGHSLAHPQNVCPGMNQMSHSLQREGFDHKIEFIAFPVLLPKKNEGRSLKIPHAKGLVKISD